MFTLKLHLILTFFLNNNSSPIIFGIDFFSFPPLIL